MADARARFGVLGPVELVIDGETRAIGGPKQRAVLAYLAINANHPVSVETLAHAVWGENPPEEVRFSLHTIVSNLRKPLRAAGIDSRAVLAQAGGGYRLAVAEGGCDVQRFLARKEAGVRALAAGRFREASEALSSALGQWRGPVLSDLRGLAFADAYAAALEDDRMGVVVARAEAETAQGRAAAVISELSHLVGTHPLREPLWEQLITALYVDGRQSDALDAVRRLRETLADELGIDPGPAIRELEQRILRQEPLTVAAAGVAAVTRVTTIIDHEPGDRFAVLRQVGGPSHPVRGAVTRIGRLRDNDIALDDGRVSRHHAAVVDTGLAYVIRDLLSSNGVFVDGTRVIDSVALRDGAVIRIGDSELVFALASNETPTQGDSTQG
ncbi:BTAD domain-containing putative transcriptional regulator [Nocardia bovistercoris]|uniref:FHA domain-containing protein n=1 Tax=Nocardia bovistercoris TaxID=2785916 RepID=A0A931I8N3_9NOCA|nr:BTAD domain-containing putative transcriptional regulator [Nocardia bovistercoris]MBH0776982.1 FHA domain-containing protein [Nocardia bovistercoris]